MHIREICGRVFRDVACGKETAVEILRRKLKCRALVIPDDDRNVARARDLNGVFHAVQPVVVGCDGKRPRRQLAEVLVQQARRSNGREDRVAAFVDEIIDFQEQPSGPRMNCHRPAAPTGNTHHN